MKRGYWDRDGFHEDAGGEQPASMFGLVSSTGASAGRQEYGSASGQVHNSPQPVIGSDRGSCNSLPERAGVSEGDAA